MSEIVTELKSSFQKYFHEEPRVFRAPGRINLIGEHTDYNDGYVMPAAINKAAYVGIARTDDTMATVIALDFNAKISFDLNEKIEPLVDGGWQNYALGVVAELKKLNPLGGFNLLLTSDIPIGAGMSSSAAIECAMAYAIATIFEMELSRVEIAQIGQKADHNYVGVRSGLMDHFSSCMGKKDSFFRLDCRSLEHLYIPFDMTDYTILLFDTQIKHDLASSEYNMRRQQCETGLSAMKALNPHIKSLRDATLEDLESAKKFIDPVIYNRCLYVIEENMRVVQATTAILSKDMKKLGDLMSLTHRGLRKLFEVSCRELDALARMALHEYPVVGSRMMGGGFGGCTINIVETRGVENVVRRFQNEYHAITNTYFKVYDVTLSDGVGEID